MKQLSGWKERERNRWLAKQAARAEERQGQPPAQLGVGMIIFAIVVGGLILHTIT